MLNGNGYGTVYGAAQAILDAAAAGTGVINLSFGTATQPPSDLLQQAIHKANQPGVVVVAAAGNPRSRNQQEYPAAWSRSSAGATRMIPVRGEPSPTQRAQLKRRCLRSSPVMTNCRSNRF